MKKKYFASGFIFIAYVFEKFCKRFEFIYKYAPASGTEVFRNYFMIKRMIRTKEMEDYDVVHLGNWETILAFKKTREDQIFVAHAHGFYPGLNYSRTIVELPFVKRQMAKILKLFIDKKMIKRIKSADLFYVSTPNMLLPAKKIRKDAIWMPNPINTEIFNPNGKKTKLDGNPSVFLPTRIHAFKNPLFGVHLFNEIKKKYPGAKLHIINYGLGADPLYIEFKRKLLDEGSIIEHKRMSHEKLAELYRGSDIVLGQFNELLGNLSLVELEAMACGAALVTLDKYEIETPLNSLQKLSFKLIEDKKFRKEYIRKNSDYVKNVHSFKTIYDIHRKNLKKFKVNLV